MNNSADEAAQVEDGADLERELMNERMQDALVPGFEVEFDPEDAERAGAFEEDALSEADAKGSADDLLEAGAHPERSQRIITSAN